MRFLSKTKNFLRSSRRRAFELTGSDRYSRFALFDLDRKLQKYITFCNGFFIEAGANDGLSQSNTYLLERFRGWRGLLIEPIPELAEKCRVNRPNAITVNTALVATDDTKFVRMKSAHLMSKIHVFKNDNEEHDYAKLAAEVQGLSQTHDVDVPARTLSSILDEKGIEKVDFFSLDVEGYELEVLSGLNLTKHSPTYLLVETKTPELVTQRLGDGYTPLAQLTHHDYLYQSRSTPLEQTK